MKLPNFLEFDAFNKIRATMGAEELGDFVFFDPKKHLTGLERLELQADGLPVSADVLSAASDFTLIYKDSRVLVYLANPLEGADWLFHLSDCDLMRKYREDNRLCDFQAKTFLPTHNSGTYKVCTDCLQKMRYQNFDGVRNRHREYSQRIEDSFNLDEFFNLYPIYPVVMRQEVPLF